jgi:transposase
MIARFALDHPVDESVDGMKRLASRLTWWPTRSHKSTPAVIAAGRAGRIVIEASTDSECVARCLEALGHEAIVADPNFAPMYATRTRKVKTDRRGTRDARGFISSPTDRASRV